MSEGKKEYSLLRLVFHSPLLVAVVGSVIPCIVCIFLVCVLPLRCCLFLQLYSLCLYVAAVQFRYNDISVVLAGGGGGLDR